MEGEEVSVEAMTVNGETTIVTITDKMTTPPPYFVELGHVEPSRHPEWLQEKIKEITKQAVAAILGLVAMVVVSRIPYHFWERFAIPAYLVSAVLILLVLTPLGYEANGARRWLRLGISIQPAEIAKLAMILFLASLLNTTSVHFSTSAATIQWIL